VGGRRHVAQEGAGAIGMRLSQRWKEAFLEPLRNPEASRRLREASINADLTSWTAALTDAVVESCATLGWTSSAKGHRQELLPEPRSEYLSLDIMAFPAGDSRWRFPIAAMELENSTSDDRIAYSLWKVTCVRTDLRVVFCYRKDSEAGAPLVRRLVEDVVKSLPMDKRVGIEGETAVVVGSRGDSATFPYGFFKWWRLDLQTADYQLM
jgi:hypothetical protein